MTGALLFAFNNESIDYVAMAAWSADRIHRHLDLPVCLVTDKIVADPVFDRVIIIDRSPSDHTRSFDDISQPVTWYNQDRVCAMDLSPWDRTLVLDVDYVVASDRLRDVLHLDRDFLCHQLAYDLAGSTGRLDGLNSFGASGMPMAWATVMFFRRSALAQHIFDCMRMIRDNWTHYRDLFKLGRSAYRNDYALAISLGIVHGHWPRRDYLPFSLATVLPSHGLDQIQPDQFRVEWRDQQQRSRWIDVKHIDFHAMCKGQLGTIVANAD